MVSFVWCFFSLCLRAQALKLVEVAAANVNTAVRAPFESWLFKRGDVRKAWKKRYFLLQHGKVMYFENDKKKGALGAFSASGARIVSMKSSFADEGRTGAIFGVTPHSQVQGAGVAAGEDHRQYILEAADEKLRAKWIEMLVLHGAVDDGVMQEGVSNQLVAYENWVKKRGGSFRSEKKARVRGVL